ncbi:hypothetical protein D6D19_06908 [Aureobasidium pullulans]|uniref:Uncharacterized protein n=1 Tax=Aureobasidium pullulans TaxID=5580 RepID=A0A4S8ZZL1_AURPU|nr:hypothetical protein D6D20_06325 [Aureobasidium pullulans]THW71994.1 hypothetical protein D6D19_06908 [Aureobasidium pullulans]
MSEAALSPFRSSFRDVGASINQYAGAQLITEGKLYICACLDDATDDDNEFLRNDIRLKTIVDTDRKQHRRFDTMPTTNGATGKLAITKFLGITRCGVSLMSKSYIENIMAQLSTWTKLWVPVTDVIIARGPIRESLDVLDTARQQICELFDTVLCHNTTYPLLICGGKLMRDQNLLVVLLLLLLDVPVQHISTNFVSSVQDLQIDLSQCENEGVLEIGQAMVSTRDQWVGAMKEHLDKSYRGVGEYFLQGSVNLQMLSGLRDALQAGSKVE